MKINGAVVPVVLVWAIVARTGTGGDQGMSDEPGLFDPAPLARPPEWEH